MIFCFYFILACFRLGFLQFVQGADLKEKAFKQQTVSKLINPKRGNIFRFYW